MTRQTRTRFSAKQPFLTHACLALVLTIVFALPALAQDQSATSAAEPSTAEASPPPAFMDMVRVDGGSFAMGSANGANEYPVHQVTLTGFFMGRYTVSRAQYQDVMGKLPKQGSADASLPVSNVSWLDAVEFCNALSQREGLEPAYAIKGKIVSLDPAKNGYRLPSEAEFEYAAKGGNLHSEFYYAGSNKADEVAWFDANSKRVVHPAGTKAPNALGIFDLSGNVAEWCQDFYEAYRGKAQTDPFGPAKGSVRCVRGGSYAQNENTGRVSFRTAQLPKSGYPDIGFRVVRR